jgi:uncharacterized phage protein (TIGR01671 family)
MSREINFRAYWKGVNEMRYFIPGNFEDTRNGWAMSFIMADENKDKNIFLGNAEIMQYTGLKDKNGKEIYEGDVLSVRPKGANYPIKYVVVFNDEYSFRMRFSDRYMRGEGSFYDEKIDCSKHDIFDVIGNIYEHPELLKH